MPVKSLSGANSPDSEEIAEIGLVVNSRNSWEYQYLFTFCEENLLNGLVPFLDLSHLVLKLDD